MSAGAQRDIDEMPEAQFLARLRDATQRYLASLDAWERQYQRYYRIAAPGPGCVSADLEALQREYLRTRKDLQECVPRARRLCLKYGLREPWQATLHIALGARTPQTGMASAIGKGERMLLQKCLADLDAASSAYAKSPPLTEAAPHHRPRGILRRLTDYFF